MVITSISVTVHVSSKLYLMLVIFVITQHFGVPEATADIKTENKLFQLHFNGSFLYSVT